MKHLLCSTLLLFVSGSCYSQSNWTGNTSPTYPALIEHLQKLDKAHKELSLYNMGPSDYGLPIYLFVINVGKDSTRTFAKAQAGTTILINNAIHPGEPDGINACLIWLDQWIAQGKPLETKNGDKLPVIAFIPAYNVGGMMNRSSTSRANQNGPEEYGFRGSTRNFDLNRDFIKMDSKKAFTFAKIFHSLDPDVFIDNHVSNGADYQYTLTYIASMKERMSPQMNELTYEKCIPYITANVKQPGWDLFPYVELKGETPAQGIHAFNDLPRYAMGYASLFHSISFTVETHMLKPFPQRVQATLAFMEGIISFTTVNALEIEAKRSAAKLWARNLRQYAFNYQLTEKADSISFKGYEHSFPLHPITGLKELPYDRTKPYERMIPWFKTYVPKDSVAVPEYYVVGGQEQEVIDRLTANHVLFETLTSASIDTLHVFSVKSYKSPAQPYEGHFKLSQIEVGESERA
ncbi:MAG: M14 family zinc carboxypeptidase, partial [Crocinitomicaceae bacterium]|nr:M14 family zinc carboxypeptidase [Crocinitomicaceae bacterium]